MLEQALRRFGPLPGRRLIAGPASRRRVADRLADLLMAGAARLVTGQPRDPRLSGFRRRRKGRRAPLGRDGVQSGRTGRGGRRRGKGGSLKRQQPQNAENYLTHRE